jgi:beta-phosphoglucomutase
MAALFDLDGTLVDNMRFHLEAWRVVLGELGVTLDDARMHREFSGKKSGEIIPVLLDRPLDAAEVLAIEHRKEALYRELYRPSVRLVPGARELIERLRARGIKVAIASAAPPENRAMVIDALQLAPLLDAVVGGEEVVHGKPSPDLFLLAARRVGVAPERCLVFEDAVNGVLAAIAAGAGAVGVTTLETAEQLRAAGATWTMGDYLGLPAALEGSFQ